MLRILFLFFLLCYGSACSYTDRLPELPDEPVSTAERKALQAQYLMQVSRPRSYKILYAVRQSNPVASYRYATIFNAPNQFRLEILPSTGFYSLGLYLQNNDQALYIDQGERKVITAVSPAILFEGLFGLPLPPEDLPMILLGQLPGRVLSDVDFNWYHISEKNLGIATASLAEYWEIDRHLGRLKRVQLRDAVTGRLFVEVTFEYQESKPEFPSSIGLEAPLADFSMNLIPVSQKMNVPVKQELFFPIIPDQFIRESIE